ncbi:OprD family outer membrane porin [Pseudomonas salomonii]|uniref:Outer membrane porin, OprD family n=1 Tax=Pseudomonas salomonii TaxID=191391 RepID=A0A1H3UKP0_9PSED|nr:OprD family outer membrane porin [Pseudomonas salomonii]SDZ62259.1 outer membrane porin, OprD family [Pseudomonas salomonii]
MAKYDVDFAAYGVAGLTTGLWYARGWGIDGTHYDGDRNGAHTGYNVRGLDSITHWELGLTAGYIVQSGQFKNTALRTIIYHHRAEAGQIDGSYDEFRLVANVPLDLF